MQWDDFSFSGSDYDFGGGLDAGSFSPSDYSGFSLGGNSGGYDFGIPSAPAGEPAFSLGGTGGLNTGGLYAPNAGGINQGFQPQQQQGGLMGALPAMLGLGGGLAGLAGVLAGGGQGASQQRTVSNAGQGSMNSANSGNAIAAQGMLPAQQMQMSLLQALQSGQGLPAGYQQLIEQAFQPQLGSLYEQAANQGRRRGFHDAPAQSPPGGAILGPGLANIQGQMAQSKLGLMQSLPGLYQNPINSQINAQGQASQGLMNSAGMTQGMQGGSQSIMPQVGQMIGSGLQGLGQSMQQSQQQAQQQANFDKMISLSGSPRMFAEGGIVTEPTNAIIGEKGPEAVIPLEHPLMQILIKALSGKGMTANSGIPGYPNLPPWGTPLPPPTRLESPGLGPAIPIIPKPKAS